MTMVPKQRNDGTDGDYPPYWDFTEDGLLDGQFLRLEMGHTKHGDKPVAVFVVGEAERSVWLFHAVLRNELKRLRPETGEHVKIRYKGSKEGLAGQTYEDYSVVMPDRPSDVSWDDLGDDTPDPETVAGDDENPPF